MLQKRELTNDIEIYSEIRNIRKANEELLNKYAIAKENEHKITISQKTFFQKAKDLAESYEIYGDSRMFEFIYENNLKRIKMLKKYKIQTRSY
jgi:hypothetical protein